MLSSQAIAIGSRPTARTMLRKSIAGAPARSGGLAERSARPVRSVVCAVERGLGSLDAARHAAALAGDGRLQLVAVRQPFRLNHGDPYLAAARFIALREGTTPELSRLDGPGAVAELLALADATDALVVADRADDGGRSAIARAAIRRADTSVMVARRLARGTALTDRIVVAADDGDEDGLAPRAAGALVGRDGTALVGRLPADDAGTIVDVARGLDATLLVVAGRAGPFDSVAARVAEAAHCPVLVARRAFGPRRARRGRRAVLAATVDPAR